jgi:RIP metalloprotease RseP
LIPATGWALATIASSPPSSPRQLRELGAQCRLIGSKISRDPPRLQPAQDLANAGSLTEWVGLKRASREAFQSTVHLSVQTVSLLSDLIRGRVAAKAALQGPVGIAQAAGQAARNGYKDLLNLVAVLSVSGGLLNLFPLAPLDGGHMAILLGEAVVRRDFSTAVKIWVMNAGALVLFDLITLVLYSDLSKTSLLGRYLR